MKNSRLWIQIATTVALVTGAILYLSRGPDFDILWARRVPSFLPKEDLSVVIQDTRNWPIFFHELKETMVTRVSGGIETPVKESNSLEQGMLVTFKMEPKAKEWKRYEIRAEITEVSPGKSISFRLLPESQAKVAKMLGGLEWSFSIQDPIESLKPRGYLSSVAGEAKAQTLTGRARFFGRVASKILMNQTYPIDLVRLANFEENKEAKAGDYAPVYK